MSPRRLIARLALAALVPACAFLALEGALRAVGYGRPTTFLVADTEPGCLRTNPEFAKLFLPGSFDLRPLNFRVRIRKDPGALRVVLLGESAAQGVPVPSFGFAQHLRAQLRARYPGREVEVINTGIVAINSHVVYQIARETALLKPDLYVVYMGNNEVVGPYGPGCAYLSQMPPLWVIRASVFVRATRTGQLLAGLIGSLSPSGGRPAEWGGMSMFVDHAVRGDDARLEAVYRNYASNLRDIVRVASACGARTVLCTPVGNYRDCAPFLSLHRPGLSASDRAAWTAAFDAGCLQWRLGNAAGARPLMEEALRIDPQYADTHFILGRLAQDAGDTASARERFAAALHWDALRFRPDAPIGEIVRSVAASSPGVVLCDAARELGADPGSSAPLCGRDLLFEHVHLDWEGSYRMGRLLAEGCAAALGAAPSDGAGRLDRASCAAALAYTGHERLPMLLRIDVLVRKPPFTNQLTYVTDQAAMARDIAAATAVRGQPATLEEAERAARAALRADPRNPSLAGILEGIDRDRGDAADALAMATTAAAMLPSDYALAADRATLLEHLGRSKEAEDLLLAAARSADDLDLLAPVLADHWRRNSAAKEGIAFMEKALAARPLDRRLRVVLGSLLEAAGDTERAARELRRVLSADPGDSEALDLLVGLLDAAGRKDQADAAVLDAAPSQPGNQANNVRAAHVLEARGDADGSVRFLQAAERGGPVNATFELTLGLKLYRLGRLPETLTRLALARQLSLGEGNPGVTASIEGLVRRLGAPSAAARP